MANKVTRTLSEDEIVKIFRYLTIDVKQMLFLQLNTGLRISDIILLKAKDIMFGKLEIKERKTGKPQLTRINMDVVEYLFKNRVYNGEYMFWDEKCNPKSIIRKVEWQIQKACDMENINSEFISTHSFRKTFATDAYNRTKDIVVVQELLNHSSAAVTQRYIRINKEKVDETREKTAIGFKAI